MEKQTRQVGILGGTFDPIHYGHLVIAEEVRAALDLAEVFFIPVGKPPHKNKRVTPAAHRLAMLELALASNPFFSISRIELERPGPSYTVDTLRQLHSELGTNTELFFVIGWDSLEDLPEWHDPEGIIAELNHLVAVRRPGYDDDIAEAKSRVMNFEEDVEIPDASYVEEDFLDELEDEIPGIRERLIIVPAPQLEISASDLRQRVKAGRPIKYQVPEAVERYIADQGLYR